MLTPATSSTLRSAHFVIMRLGRFYFWDSWSIVHSQILDILFFFPVFLCTIFTFIGLHRICSSIFRISYTYSRTISKKSIPKEFKRTRWLRLYLPNCSPLPGCSFHRSLIHLRKVTLQGLLESCYVGRSNGRVTDESLARFKLNGPLFSQWYLLRPVSMNLLR